MNEEKLYFECTIKKFEENENLKIAKRKKTENQKGKTVNGF